MFDLWQDLRFGIRMLGRTPILSTVAALSLALGIAGATAMFALVSSFFLEPLPFGDQDGLVLMQQLRRGESIEMASGVSAPNLRDLAGSVPAVTSWAAYTDDDVNLTGLDQPERIRVITGSPNLFEVLRVQPSPGRGFVAEEGIRGDVLVLTHAYWESRFAADPVVLGRTLMIDGRPHTVVGVTPPGFEMLPANVQAFRPSDFTAAEDRGQRDLLVFGRLRAGATVDQARSQLDGQFARLEAEYPDANRGWTAVVQPARKWFPGPTDTKLVIVLVAVALFGVAIACANVANLLLGRAEGRIREMGVRTALGAGRARVLRQLLTESIVLALGGAAIGVLFAFFVIRGLRTAMPPMMPRSFLPSLDGPTLVATVAMAIVVGVVFGLAPALHATGRDLRAALGEHSRGGTAGRTRKRVRNAFVIGELAVALALLTGAGFLLQAMDSLTGPRDAMDASALLTFQLTLPEHRYAGDADLALFAEETERALAGTPGVDGVALMGSLPRSMANPRTSIHVDGSPVVEPNERPRILWQAVNPDYFRVLEIGLLEGRLIDDSDRADARPVIVVNRAFADRHLPGRSALGARIDVLGEPREIVGVVADIVQDRIPLDGPRDVIAYLPLTQRPMRSPAVAVRAAGDPLALATAVRQAVWSVDADQPIAQVRTLEAHIRESLAGPRVIGQFVLALGILATILAAIGVYGVMSHNVAQSTREIGIRMAVGARSGQVVGMITRRGAQIAVIGLAAGMPLALLVHRGVVSSLNLFELTLSVDYAVGAGALLTVVVLLASWLPALRAARVHPARALQRE